MDIALELERATGRLFMKAHAKHVIAGRQFLLGLEGAVAYRNGLALHLCGNARWQCGAADNDLAASRQPVMADVDLREVQAVRCPFAGNAGHGLAIDADRNTGLRELAFDDRLGKQRLQGRSAFRRRRAAGLCACRAGERQHGQECPCCNMKPIKSGSWNGLAPSQSSGATFPRKTFVVVNGW